MEELVKWLPTFLIAALTGSLFGITFLLYRRWRTKNYFLLSSAIGATSIVHILLFGIAAVGSAGSELSETLYSGLAVLLFIGIQASYYHFFIPKKRKELQLFGVAAALSLLGLITFFVNKGIGATILAVVVIGFSLLLIIKIIPQLPKKNKFLLAHVLFAIGILLQVSNQIVDITSLFFVATLIVASAYTMMLIIFYHRIVDMVEAVSYSAVTDGLTGLYNKTHFIKKVKDYIGTDGAYALVFTDIDNFKRLNDTQGHPMGDAILKLVAKIMKETFQDVALVGRYGGEEMVALVTSDKVDPGELSELFRSRVEELTPEIFPVTISVGYSIYEEDVMAEEFIKQADEAMYKAKNRGKNRVVSYQVF